MFSYQQNIFLLKFLPLYILKKISNELYIQFDNKENVIQEIINNYSFSNKERKSNKEIKNKSDNFMKVSKKYILPYFKNYKMNLITDIKNFQKKYQENEYTYNKKIDYFYDKKSELLQLLHNNIFNKSDFIDYCYDLIIHLEMYPLKHPQTIKDCLFNYQYYNALIKRKNKLLKNKYGLRFKDIQDKDIEFWYSQKDESIKVILDLCNNDYIESYYVSVESTKLFMSLFEIYIPSKSIILHSVNKEIKKTLMDRNIFKMDITVSKVDKYVNTRY